MIRLPTVSNFREMRKGFLHDRLGFGGRTCRACVATRVMTSADSLADVVGGFAGTEYGFLDGPVGAAVSVGPRSRGGGHPSTGRMPAGVPDHGVIGGTLWRECRLSPMLGQSPTAGAKGHGGGGRRRPPSSSGLGHRPFKAAARVRIPLGAPSATGRHRLVL